MFSFLTEKCRNVETQGYKSNNKYPNFPPLTNDGRNIITTHQPDPVYRKKTMEENNIHSNWEYRQYLTKNATNIMEHNFREFSNDIGYVKRYADAPPTNSLHHYSSLEDETKVFGTNNSDLKNIYLSREQLESRRIVPTLTQEQLLFFQR